MSAKLKAIGFEKETQLIDVVLRNLTRFTNKDNLIVSTEVLVGAGIVDVMFASALNPNNSKNTEISDLEALLLSNMYFERPLSSQIISKKSNLGLKEVDRLLESLVNRAICQKQGGCYVRNRNINQGIISVEGKLRDWRRALGQAIRNKLFSEKSFVALDSKYSNVVINNLELFKFHNIGLSLVSSDDKTLEIIYSPVSSRPITRVMPVIAEFALLSKSVLLQGGYSCLQAT